MSFIEETKKISSIQFSSAWLLDDGVGSCKLEANGHTEFELNHAVFHFWQNKMQFSTVLFSKGLEKNLVNQSSTNLFVYLSLP